ncbi:MAG: hypothetical protein IAE91_10080 [Ignavibacteriaceae bacterium]|nr:hypothetical protein [Ignavibacteriaceae bacterium]
MYEWLCNYSDIGEKYFDFIYPAKERLLDHGFVKDSVAKAKKWDNFLKECGIENSDDILENNRFREFIIQNANKFNSEEDQSKALISSSRKKTIGNIDDLKEILLAEAVPSLSDIDGVFSRYDSTTIFSDEDKITAYEFVQELLKRAVKNVVDHLKQNPDYDLSNIRVNHTVINYVRYKNIPVNLVVRPNDYNKVIIYYENELAHLKLQNTQFWVDNDSIQKQITIGDILEAMRLGVIHNL